MLPLRPRWPRWSWGLVAYLVVVVFAISGIVSDISIFAARPELSTLARASAIVADLLLLASIVLARWYSRVAVAAALLALGVSYVAWQGGIGFFAVGVAVFVVALRADRAAAVAVGGCVTVWLVALGLRDLRIIDGLKWLLPTLVLAAGLGGWALGRTTRRAGAAEARAQTLEAEAAGVRLRERQLLARELHDVVAHGLTLISMQAAVLRVTQDPARQETARAAIERSSRDSLDELKRLLQVLRASDIVCDDATVIGSEPHPAATDTQDVVAGGGVGGAGAVVGATPVGRRGPDGADTGGGAAGPAGGVAVWPEGAGGHADASVERVARLVDRLAADLRAVGHPVEVTCAVAPLAQSVEGAADWVLRESVTNIVKHAGTDTPCAIDVRMTADALEICVDNEVRDEHLVDLGSTRLGLVGLTERVELLGGGLRAGLDGDRWRVRAVLPLAG